MSSVVRGHAAALGDAAPGRAQTHGGGFAGVLAGVREQDDPAITPPGDGHRGAAIARPDPADRDAAGRVGESAAIEPVVVDDLPPPGPAQTPWLLLSLSSGPHAWNSGCPASPAATGDVGDADVAAMDHDVLVVDTAGAGQAPPPATAMAPESAALHHGGVADPGGLALDAIASAGRSAQAASPADTPVVGPPDLAGGWDTGAPFGTDGMAVDAARSAGDGTLERLLTASLRTDGAPERELTAVADASSALSPAVRQLAQLLASARNGGPSGAGQSEVPLTPEVLLASVAGPMPTARATEILLRLAQSGGPAVRSAGDVQTSAATPIPMLASALAPTGSVVAPAPTAALPPQVGDQVMQQVVQSLRMQWKDGVGEAKVHLRPDALGSVSVTLRVEGGAVTAVVRAESPHVQEWVLQHQQTLRQQLEAAGLHLDELVVSPDDHHDADRQPDAPPDRRRRHRGPADEPADSTRFEGLL